MSDDYGKCKVHPAEQAIEGPLHWMGPGGSVDPSPERQF